MNSMIGGAMKNPNISQEEWAKRVKKSHAKGLAHAWCLSHGFPVEQLEETEEGYIFKVEFK